MEKIDPYKHKERYLKWKEFPSGRFLSLNKFHKELILKYLNDMEIGINISKINKKGSRSYIRLNTLRDKLTFVLEKLEERRINNILKITEEEIHSFFNDLERGIIKRKDGLPYKCAIDFLKIFKAFWHWNMQKDRKLKDITAYLSISQQKPQWVYLTESQVIKLMDYSKFEYRVLISFLFDSGIRAPTELINIRVNDLSNDFKECNIREEVSKTFGRRIKLMFSSELLKKFVEIKKLSGIDRVFDLDPKIVNRYLKRLGKKIFGDAISPAGERYSNLTMYDFRHSSACYWRQRYKKTQGILYRFGWKKEDRLNYYTEFLGMRDTIEERDMLIGEKQNDIERRLIKSEVDQELFWEKIKELTLQLTNLQTTLSNKILN
jgi:integrase